MKTDLRWALVWWGLTGVAAAAPLATVEAVRSSVWLDRAGTRVALAVGQSLDGVSRIVTAGQARVVLRLAEGSTVKLGENTTFSLSQAPDERDRELFTAALEVLKGAFRFTTTALSQDFRRDIRATVGTATIGIRGTDVWGKAASDRDFIVLIEGTIDISRAGETVSMSTPQTIYNAVKDRPVDPLAPVDSTALTAWAQETELQAGTGIATTDGRWSVVAGDYLHLPSASGLKTLLNSAGYPASVTQNPDDASRHQVTLQHFATEADAAAIASVLKAAFAPLDPRVITPGDAPP